ncbi:YidC/Oxa1 family membrane protein insertase [Patescibacteria group bacterium]|nr:YidC/Oxa1 family membrane protein insertase [Patescibacteria group bacterium]
MISQLFQLLIYQPLFNALIFIYSLLPNLGLSVIILTGLIKLLTLPLNAKAFRLQQIMAGIQSELKSVQKKYKDNPEKQAQAVSEIFKREKVSPLGPIVPILIQLPVLIALYQLFWHGLWSETNHLYSFISKPEIINPLFLGIDLSQPNVILAVLAGIAQLVQTLMLPNALKKNKDSGDMKEKMSAALQKQMIYLFPILTVFILLKLPSALGLYWLATSVFSVWQQYALNKPTLKK